METMSGFMLLTFWLCAGVNSIMLRNMSKRQKGLLLGVTLPPEADALPEVQALVKQYRTRLGTLCLSAPRSVCRWPLCRRPPSR